MKLALKSGLLALVCVSGAAMAANFSGPEAGASVTMNGGSVRSDLKSSDDKDRDYGQTSMGIKLHAGYGFDMGNDTVVLVGFSYNPTDIKSGTSSTSNIKISNSWSLSVAPGMKLNDTSLVYVKLAYEAGKFQINSTTSINQSISGLGYGVGLRTEINKTTFLETEIKQVNYKKFTYLNALDMTPSATVGSVGVVFKF